MAEPAVMSSACRAKDAPSHARICPVNGMSTALATSHAQILSFEMTYREELERLVLATRLRRCQTTGNGMGTTSPSFGILPSMDVYLKESRPLPLVEARGIVNRNDRVVAGALARSNEYTFAGTDRLMLFVDELVAFRAFSYPVFNFQRKLFNNALVFPYSTNTPTAVNVLERRIRVRSGQANPSPFNDENDRDILQLLERRLCE
ncbi:hypothetical protein HGRIS_003906 [Hohenbuehelia grisea]|uniref:Uncharacterized protein n=1 Tax=Hohenbuehelia grisea TaxID=104357 RepID=A0ABR3JGY6_9AGAR